jgi:hypothetical protein
MKRRWPLLLGALVAVTLIAGCINYEEEITLKRDGSGEVNMHFWLSSAFAKMAKSSSGGGEGPPLSEEDARKRCEGKEGITFKSFRSEEKDDEYHAYITLGFDSLDALSAVQENQTYSFAEESGVITYTATMESGGGGFGPSGPGMTEPPTPPAKPTTTKKDPQAAAKHYQAGMAAKKANKLDEAAKELEQAVQNNPDHLDAHWALAWTYSSLDDKSKARREFTEVLRLAPADSDKHKEAQKALTRLSAEAAAPSAPEGMEEFGKAMGEGMEQMMAGMMEGGFTYTVHFPGEVLSVEGPGASKEGSTATWKLDFGDMMGAGMSGGMTMKATAKAGSALPIIPIVIGAGVLAVLVVAVTLLRRRG